MESPRSIFFPVNLQKIRVRGQVCGGYYKFYVFNYYFKYIKNEWLLFFIMVCGYTYIRTYGQKQKIKERDAIYYNNIIYYII